jgi:Rab-GTPase-TBC domain
MGPLRTFSTEETSMIQPPSSSWTSSSSSQPSSDQPPHHHHRNNDNNEQLSLREVIYGRHPFRLKIAKSDVFCSREAASSSADDAVDDDQERKQLEPNTSPTTTSTATTPPPPCRKKSSSSDDLDDIAPVSSKWSDSFRNNDDDDDASIVSVEDDNDNDDEPSPHIINLPYLRKIVSAGGILVEDDDETGQSYRAVAWRLLLNYLPPNVSQWRSSVTEQRHLYTELCHNIFVDIADAHDRSSELRGVRPFRFSSPQQNHDDGGSGADGASATPWSSQHHPRHVIALSSAMRDNGNYHHQRPVVIVPPVLRDYWKKHKLDERVLERAIMDNINLLRTDAILIVNENYDGDEKKKKHNNSKGSPNDDTVVVTSGGDENSDNNRKNSRRQEEEPVVTKAVVVDQQGSLHDFAESAQLLEEIRKDVIRTHPDLSFFLEPYQNLGRRRYAALERILFVWSKYNKGVRYVQGMNEIVGIIYYVLANDTNEEWSEWAEADTYWLFNALLVEMSDVFVAGKDEADTGIQGRILALQSLLGRHDPEVREHLDELGIETSFYAIRWWTTLLSREFLLPDVIRLWDSMFASTHKDNFLRFACVTMIMKVRDQLLRSDFSSCLRLLHSYPSVNMDDLLESSRALYIYESQITLA